jgi:hypothetical protein
MTVVIADSSPLNYLTLNDALNATYAKSFRFREYEVMLAIAT